MSRTAFTTTERNDYIGARPHTLIGLGVASHIPASVWVGTASAPSFPSDGTGAGTLTISTVSGSYTAVNEGMTVAIIKNSTSETNNPQFYYTYARKTPIANTLYIDGLGANTVTFTGASIIVYDQYLPQPRRLRFNSGDWLVNFDQTYTDQNDNFGPYANMGPGTVVYKNGSVTSSFDGTRSFTASPGATITDYLWTFPDGTTSTSATPTWANSTAYPSGKYYSLLVTDSNGDTAIGYRLYFKFDSSHKPKTDITITEHKGTWGGGYTLTLDSVDTLWSFGTEYTGLVNQCMVFSTTAYYDTVIDIGGNFPGSENIRMNGYIVGRNYKYAVDGSTYTYTLSTLDELLRNQYGFPLTMDDTGGGAAANWLQMNPISLNNIMVHYCKWRSTLSFLTDLTLCDQIAADDAKKYMDFPDGLMWEQLQAIYHWLIGGTVSVDWQNAIYCEQDIFISQATVPDMMEIFLEGAGYPREGWTHPATPYYINKVAKFAAYGFDYVTGVGSRAPDDPAAHGANLEEISAGLMGTQTQLNTWAGRRRAQLDNHYPPASIPMRGIMPIDCTPQSTLSTPSPFSPQEFTLIVRTVSIEYDTEHGMMFYTFGCEHYIDSDLAGTSISFT